MTIETGIDPIAVFDEAVKLRHLAGALYCVALHAPCTCEGELCHDPNCDECTTAINNNEVCPRCLSMSKYEAWVGIETLPVVHPHGIWIGYKPVEPHTEEEKK
jgi:hypothetical protein